MPISQILTRVHAYTTQADADWARFCALQSSTHITVPPSRFLSALPGPSKNPAPLLWNSVSPANLQPSMMGGCWTGTKRRARFLSRLYRVSIVWGTVAFRVSFSKQLRATLLMRESVCVCFFSSFRFLVRFAPPPIATSLACFYPLRSHAAPNKKKIKSIFNQGTDIDPQSSYCRWG